MSTMNLTDIRSYVYDYLAIDSSDLPTAVLDALIAQSWWRIINSERRWSFFEKEATLTTEADQQTYPLVNLTNDTHTWVDISSIEGPNWLLRPIPHRFARRRYAPGTSQTVTHSYYFSIHAGAVYLWPTPAGEADYTVTGYRRPTDWIGDASEPDAPEEFHSLVAQGALYLAYTQQDDPASSEQVRGVFETALRNLRLQYVDDNVAGPVVLNGGGPRYDPTRLFDRADFFGS